LDFFKLEWLNDGFDFLHSFFVRVKVNPSAPQFLPNGRTISRETLSESQLVTGAASTRTGA
jgi:hypothetical protein